MGLNSPASGFVGGDLVVYPKPIGVFKKVIANRAEKAVFATQAIVKCNVALGGRVRLSVGRVIANRGDFVVDVSDRVTAFTSTSWAGLSVVSSFCVAFFPVVQIDAPGRSSRRRGDDRGGSEGRELHLLVAVDDGSGGDIFSDCRSRLLPICPPALHDAQKLT